MLHHIFCRRKKTNRSFLKCLKSILPFFYISFIIYKFHLSLFNFRFLSIYGLIYGQTFNKFQIKGLWMVSVITRLLKDRKKVCQNLTIWSRFSPRWTKIELFPRSTQSRELINLIFLNTSKRIIPEFILLSSKMFI